MTLQAPTANNKPYMELNAILKTYFGCKYHGCLFGGTTKALGLS